MKSFIQTILFLISILLSFSAIAQKNLSGTIIDQKTKQVLPFVNIVYYSSTKLGTTSDLDGRFHIHSKTNITSLEISFMGYKSQTIQISELQNLETIKIELETEAYTLPEAEVYGRENPAHRIINSAIHNRKKNNPKSLKSFKYETYSKMFFTFDVLFYKNNDTLSTDEYPFPETLSSKDSNILEINKFRNDQYLFLMESVTKQKYKQPGKVHEEVIASRVSGFKNPAFALISSELQSFTIYSDYISVAGFNYLSPLAKNSTNKYLFIIEDTLINPSKDTTYTLSYRPRKNKNFKGLEGIIHINTNGFAVENFSTKPTLQETYSVTIRQKYELVQDSAWFPTQLDADFTFGNILASQPKDTTDTAPDDMLLYGKAKTYIRNIDLNPELKNREFSYIALDYEQEANEKDSLFWSQYRVDSITQKELNTYQVIDSIGDEYNFEKKLELLSYLMKGQVPLGKFSLQVDGLLDYNVAEGFRFGLGLYTNDKLYKNANIGGYGAYGLGDYRWKYGGSLKINLRDFYDSHIEVKYKNDVGEVGGFSFSENKNLLDPETFRDFLIKDIVYEESGEIAIEARYIYYLKARIYGRFSNINFYNQYYELSSQEGIVSQFQIPEVGIKMRYAHQEHYIKTPLGIQAIKTKYPVFFFNIAKSIVFDDYTIDYTRITAKVQKDFLIRNIGVSSISLQSGYAFGDIPFYKLFNGRGSYYPFTVVALNSFGTMRLNEFISDQFVYLFYRHNFGKLLFKTTHFQPEISLVHNMGWGTLSNREQQLGVATRTMEKGYIESGFVLDNLFTLNYFQYGVGVYYRYGAYALPEIIDNFGFKLSFKFTLGTL